MLSAMMVTYRIPELSVAMFATDRPLTELYTEGDENNMNKRNNIKSKAAILYRTDLAKQAETTPSVQTSSSSSHSKIPDNHHHTVSNGNSTENLKHNSLYVNTTLSNNVSNITTSATEKLTDTPVHLHEFCADENFWGKSDVLKPAESNFDNWSFNKSIKCPHLNISEIQHQGNGKKVHFQCSGNGAILSLVDSNNTRDIHVTSFGDTCVDNFIQNCCKGRYRVPNVVHYVWYKREQLDFVTFLSLLGVVRFIKPCLIIFHGDRVPSGHYWNFIINISPNIIHMEREPPTVIYGQQIKHKEHSGDLMRIQALLSYGGIYMDTDTVIVRSVEKLRSYPCVMSNQSSGYLGSAFIMAERNSIFLQLWLDGYRYHYVPESYTYNSMIYPHKLVKNHTDLIHIEYTTISRPNDMIGGKIYDKLYATYNWSYIYGIHLYIRIFKEPFDETAIRTMNFTVGSISRHVVYGNKELCEF